MLFDLNSLSSQVTEDLHIALRRVWPRFRSKFCPRWGNRPRQQGQECRNDFHKHLERCQVRRTRCCPQRRRDRHLRWELFPLSFDPLGGKPASPSDSERGPCFHLSFLTIFLPPSSPPLFSKHSGQSRAVPEIVNAVPRAPPSRVACVPSSRLMLSPQPQTLYPLLTMSIADHRRREREYGSLPYLHLIVIGLHKVHRLVHTVTNTKELGTCGLTTLLPFFPVLPLMSTLPELVASFKPFSVLICHSPRRTLSTHGTMPGLLRPQNLACAHDGVSPGPCMSLGRMRSEVSSLVICTSSGLGPNLVGDFLRSVFIQTLLIPVYSPIIQRSILKPSSRAYSSHSLQS